MSIDPGPTGDDHSRIGRLSKWLVVGAVLAVLIVFFGHGDRETRRVVIISSDDAGMCSAVNRGTFAALKGGVVRSTSVMVCCPGFEEFAAFARAHPQYDYGVHLTLTCDLKAPGWGPVLPRAQVPSLVDGDGYFHSSVSRAAQEADLAEVEAELRAQIRKAREAGIRITHLDHHMWFMFDRADFLQLYGKLGREFGLPIRLSREIPRRLQSAGEELVAAYNELLRSQEQSGSLILDSLEADNYSIPPGEKRGYFLSYLRNLRPGVTEFVIHCAAADDSQVEPPDAAARIADTATFSAPELRDELARLRIEVVDWGKISGVKQ